MFFGFNLECSFHKFQPPLWFIFNEKFVSTNSVFLKKPYYKNFGMGCVMCAVYMIKLISLYASVKLSLKDTILCHDI